MCIESNAVAETNYSVGEVESDMTSLVLLDGGLADATDREAWLGATEQADTPAVRKARVALLKDDNARVRAEAERCLLARETGCSGGRKIGLQDLQFCGFPPA